MGLETTTVGLTLKKTNQTNKTPTTPNPKPNKSGLVFMDDKGLNSNTLSQSTLICSKWV